jgi:hypothetical protein
MRQAATMEASDERDLYRRVIDRLVKSSRRGQGQIGPTRVRAGVWNPDAAKAGSDDQQNINLFLERLSPEDRDILAAMLADAFVSGVHEALVVLHESGITPFEDGYEGTPFNDFTGRLHDWEWPSG